MTPRDIRQYALLAFSGAAIAAAALIGYGPSALSNATPADSPRFNTETTTPSIPSTTLTPINTPPSPSSAPTLPPAPAAPPTP